MKDAYSLVFLLRVYSTANTVSHRVPLYFMVTIAVAQITCCAYNCSEP